jgi:NAD(P)-dependent dehydrogenase (short-subunit alcohol dehydrogenase family)
MAPNPFSLANKTILITGAGGGIGIAGGIEQAHQRAPDEGIEI